MTATPPHHLWTHFFYRALPRFTDYFGPSVLFVAAVFAWHGRAKVQKNPRPTRKNRGGTPAWNVGTAAARFGEKAGPLTAGAPVQSRPSQLRRVT